MKKKNSFHPCWHYHGNASLVPSQSLYVASSNDIWTLVTAAARDWLQWSFVDTTHHRWSWVCRDGDQGSLVIMVLRKYTWDIYIKSIPWSFTLRPALHKRIGKRPKYGFAILTYSG